ncbi:hypothetical protein [Sphingobium abikonense]|uniref:hypothetical protein n=1 Tax=Sphingobium abikonense TaxID=86193 RepID=UPI00351630E3
MSILDFLNPGVPEPEPITLTAPDGRPLSDEEKVARGKRAKLAMDEFLAPAINAIEAEYLSALSQMAASEPWETGKITKLAVAQRVIKSVEQHIIVAVMDGVQAEHALARAKQIAAIPEAKRRFL